MVASARALVFLTLWLTVSQVRGSYIPVEMNKTIQSLLQYYTIDPEKRFDGNNVFPKEPPSGKLEAKMLFMGGILDMYEQLLGHMLKQLPNTTVPNTGSNDRPSSPSIPSAGTANDAEMGAVEDVRKQLNYILERVQVLKTKRFKEQATFLHRLHGLKHIKMNDLVVQSKALWELPWLYEEASSLADSNTKQKRRRRQARRVKSHLRG